MRDPHRDYYETVFGIVEAYPGERYDEVGQDRDGYAERVRVSDEV